MLHEGAKGGNILVYICLWILSWGTSRSALTRREWPAESLSGSVPKKGNVIMKAISVPLQISLLLALSLLGCHDDPITPITPAAPTGLAAAAVSSSQINLSWSDASTNEDGFKIERAPGGTTTFAEIASSLPANTTSYQSTGLSASTSYTYRVLAYNAAGNSEYSNTATTATNALPSVLRVVNNSSYAIISLAVDNVEVFSYPGSILPGKNYERNVAQGAHTIRIANGYYDGTSKREMYNSSGRYVQLSGTYTQAFNDPTINQLLTQFGSSGVWEGQYWDNKPSMHLARFVYSSSGTWQFYDDGNLGPGGS